MEKTENSLRREPLGSGLFALTTSEYTFSSDAIILADFCRLRSEKRVCDLCSGCGIISLLFSAENKKRHIDAIEIQKEAAEIIEEAARQNGFDNIVSINRDLRTLDSSFFGKYDLVACNPPYKKTGTGKKSSLPSSLAARHEEFCTLEDVITVSSKLLKNGGRFCMCQRPERLCDIMTLMREHNLEPKRIRFVAQKIDTKPWLVLIEGKKSAKAGLIAEPSLIIKNEFGEDSKEIDAIYKKFS